MLLNNEFEFHCSPIAELPPPGSEAKGTSSQPEIHPTGFRRVTSLFAYGQLRFLGVRFASYVPYSYCHELCTPSGSAMLYAAAHELPACLAKQVSWPLRRPAAPLLEKGGREECRPVALPTAGHQGEELKQTKKSLNASLLTPVPAKSSERHYQSLLVLPSSALPPLSPSFCLSWKTLKGKALEMRRSGMSFRPVTYRKG